MKLVTDMLQGGALKDYMLLITKPIVAPGAHALMARHTRVAAAAQNRRQAVAA